VGELTRAEASQEKIMALILTGKETQTKNGGENARKTKGRAA